MSAAHQVDATSLTTSVPSVTSMTIIQSRSAFRKRSSSAKEVLTELFESSRVSALFATQQMRVQRVLGRSAADSVLPPRAAFRGAEESTEGTEQHAARMRGRGDAEAEEGVGRRGERLREGCGTASFTRDPSTGSRYKIARWNWKPLGRRPMEIPRWEAPDPPAPWLLASLPLRLLVTASVLTL